MTVEPFDVRNFKWYYKKIGTANKKFEDALDFVLNYNGEKEHVKVLKTYTVGPKNRVITEPTKEYQEVLDNFTTVLKAIFMSKKENKMFSLFVGLSIATPRMEIKNTKLLMTKINDYSKSVKTDSQDLIRIKFDIKNAFNSTTYFNVAKILKRLIPSSVGKTIVDKLQYLFIDDRLPQGFSTSPLIFNFVQDYIADKLCKYTNKYLEKDSKAYCKYCYDFYKKSTPITKIAYLARYADDYLFGLVAPPTTCKDHYYVMFYFLNRLFKKYGYRLNAKKFQVNHQAKKTYIRFLGHSVTGNNVRQEHTITYSAIHRYKNIRRIALKFYNPKLLPVSKKIPEKLIGYLSYISSTRTIN